MLQYIFVNVINRFMIPESSIVKKSLLNLTFTSPGYNNMYNDFWGYVI